MSLLKKMKKQWYKINKENIDVIKQEKQNKEHAKFIKDIGKFFNIKPYKKL